MSFLAALPRRGRTPVAPNNDAGSGPWRTTDRSTAYACDQRLGLTACERVEAAIAARTIALDSQ